MSIARRGLSALRALVFASVMEPFASAAAQSPAPVLGQVAIVGRVVDRHKDPVSGAEISVVIGDSTAQRARAGADGGFELRGLGAGMHEILVRRLGYKARNFTIDVTSGGPPTRLDAVLTPMPVELEQVRVMATIDESRGKLREFYEHKGRAQFGYFFGPQELERKNLRVASEVVRSIPGARLLAARFGNRIQFRGCRPMVWIDGQRIAGAELDEVMDADDIAAIEIYPSMAGLPAQYVSFESRCGVIAVWTRVS